MESMQLNEFAQLLDRHGAAPTRWPAAQAAAAQILLEHSAEARELLQSQRQLELLLAADTFEAPRPALRAAILAAAPKTAERNDAHKPVPSLLAELWALLGGVRIAGPAFAMALLLGVSLGSTLGQMAESNDEDEDLATLSYLSNDYLEY